MELFGMETSQKIELTAISLGNQTMFYGFLPGANKSEVVAKEVKRIMEKVDAARNQVQEKGPGPTLASVQPMVGENPTAGH